MRLLAAQLGGERVAEARVDVPEEAEEGDAEAEEKVQKHHQLHVREMTVGEKHGCQMAVAKF